MAEMDSHQFTEWQRYFELEPWGHPWQNLVHARHMLQFASAHSDPKKPPPQLETFLWESDDDKEVREHKSRLGLGAMLKSMVKRNNADARKKVNLAPRSAERKANQGA